MKVLQINTTYNIGSTGRIAAGIDNVLVEADIDSYCAYGYGSQVDEHHYRIINKLDSYVHNFLSRLTDGQGLYSAYKTGQFIKWVESINPDIIHLHNLHGNYFDYEIFFDYLKRKTCKVVWTLHDCWSFTGHCAYFDMVGCNKWKAGCHDCPQIKSYPPSILDRCHRNFQLRKRLFTALGDRLVLVPVSYWLAGLLKESFFSNTKIVTIHNGINLENFKRYEVNVTKPYILGVAAPWDKRKGLSDFVKLRDILDSSVGIKLVGLTSAQISSLPEGIEGIERTNNVAELAKLYSGASVFVNTTYEDNYPTVNLESIACGTPVITYNTGGSPESVADGCGIVVRQGNVSSLKKVILELMNDKTNPINLVELALAKFNERDCFKKYLNLYNCI